MGIVSSARIRYVGFFLDGFTETGSAGNLTAASRDLHLLHGRFQFAVPFITRGADSSHTRFEPYIGIEGRMLLSGDNVDAVLLGQNLTFDPGGKDSVGSVFAGANLSAKISDNLDFYAGTEVNIEGADSYRLGAKIGFKMTF